MISEILLAPSCHGTSPRSPLTASSRVNRPLATAASREWPSAAKATCPAMNTAARTVQRRRNSAGERAENRAEQGRALVDAHSAPEAAVGGLGGDDLLHRDRCSQAGSGD